MSLDLDIRALCPDRFQAYGEVLALQEGDGRPINAGTSRRRDLPGILRLGADGGQLAVFRARAQAPQGPWTALERHCRGSQTFIPLGGARCVLLVALGERHPLPHTLAAFAVRGDQGFTMHPGTWHHPLIAIDEGDFLVIERAGAADDCEVLQLDAPVRLRSS